MATMATRRLAAALTLLLVAACYTTAARQLKQDAPSSAAYVLGFGGSPARGAFVSAIARAGCALEDFTAEAGIATSVCPIGHLHKVSSCPSPGFPELGVNLVTKDVVFTTPGDDNGKPKPHDSDSSDDRAAAAAGASTDSSVVAGSTPPPKFFTGPITDTSALNDPFWRRQWAPKAIGAPAAWAKGINGRCVRVGLVDFVFGPPHNDLKNKYDFSVSKGFGNVDWTYNSPDPAGTYTAGIVGAEANNSDSVVGVAYGSTLIGASVSDEISGLNTMRLSKIAQGIIYAAKRKDEGGAGVDLIHANFPTDNIIDRTNEAQMTESGAFSNAVAVLNKAISFANRNGVLVVVPVGHVPYPTSGIDLTYQKANFTALCENANVLCVGAYGATGICKGTCVGNNYFCNVPKDIAGANYSQLHPQSNYGRSVDVAGPAGNPLNYPAPCWGTNAIFSTGRYNIRIVTGVPFTAAPHAAALAALYIQKAAMDKGILESELCNPARTRTIVSPGQIKTAIKRGAVMPPGNAGEMRKYFGSGLINVPNTLGL
ncbi:hypothetical protein HYH03_013961 [Edaphochlamys debaryana]|uniref:Peptidase S8/S53 domain-containing protein n=1 Tax=Edaphochlamys debaryana TaxID=47281 RepID=A0A836BSR8_9CHLO|nr:hypothetical protein HYH03_013961 [Edaphochlamys debaryana]|eukprot:KAG2487392.1 hypothetical protein HYH03_013961 [Edaphochlamys debaryana]